jgi:hypothetical protein
VRFTVTKAGTGSGSVTSSLGGIDCGATCESDLPRYKTVTLTAVPAAGSVFTGWSGACTGTADTCTVWLYDPDSVTATFAAIPAEPVVPPADLPAPPAPPAVPDAVAPPAAIERPAGEVARTRVTPVAVVRAPVAKTRPAVRARPKVTGRTRVGATLTCTGGTWNGSPSAYSFTWRRDGKVIDHGLRHRVLVGDRGHTLRCEVTARNAAGVSAAVSGIVRVPK